MSAWLYQLNPKKWTPETFRYEIWEGKQWGWIVGSKRGDNVPSAGDTIFFFYAKSGGNDPGIYGWAVLERYDERNQMLYFIPCAPTNWLKMDPWWDDNAVDIVDRVRGKMKQATLFKIDSIDVNRIRQGLRFHFSNT